MHKNKLSLLEFAQLKPIRNIQTYYLSERPLEKLTFVGITELFEESIQRFNEKFSLNLAHDLKFNVNPSPYMEDPQVLSKIRDLNREDMRLYEKALNTYSFKEHT